jgi:hypothetical protein
MGEKQPTDANETSGEEATPSLFERRGALRLGAAAAATASDTGTTRTVTATLERVGFSFDRRVNAVEDLGSDPTGTEPIGESLGTAVEEGTVVEFPAGTYRVDAPVELGTRSAFVGIGETASDVRFRPTDAAANRWLRLAGASESVVGGFTVVGEAAGSIGGTVDGSVVLADVAYDSSIPARAGADSHTLEIEWTGEDVTYEFTVEGVAEPRDDQTADRAVTFGPSAEGHLNGGLHRYGYVGSLADLRLSADARVAVDGVEVDPATVGEETGVEFFAAAERTATTYDLVAVRRSSAHGATLGAGNDDVVTVPDGVEHLSVEGDARVDIAREC